MMETTKSATAWLTMTRKLDTALMAEKMRRSVEITIIKMLIWLFDKLETAPNKSKTVQISTLKRKKNIEKKKKKKKKKKKEEDCDDYNDDDDDELETVAIPVNWSLNSLPYMNLFAWSRLPHQPS